MLDVIYKLWCLWNFYIGNFDVNGVGKIIGEVVIFRFIEGNELNCLLKIILFEIIYKNE